MTKSYISKFYQPSINKTRTISKSAQSLSTFSNNKSNGIFSEQIKVKISGADFLGGGGGGCAPRKSF